jgi:D-alanyl-D-alanine carboxypeptidase (penicillin-binding protein 5/6)
MDTFRTGQKAEIGLANTNKLLKNYEGTIGLKTGFTTKAGYCLSTVAKRNDMTLISVILGDPDSNTRFAESKKLLDHGFNNFERAPLNKKDDFVQEIAVKKGIETKVNGIFSNDVELLVEKNSKGKISRETNIDETVIAPVKAGQKLGEVIYKLDGKEMAKVDIVAQADVQKASAFKLFLRMIAEWLGLGRSK